MNGPLVRPSNWNRVPIIDPVADPTGQNQVFGVVTQAFKSGTATGMGVTGLTLATIVTNATWIALAVTCLAAIIVGINALDGIKGKEIRRALK